LATLKHVKAELKATGGLITKILSIELINDYGDLLNEIVLLVLKLVKLILALNRDSSFEVTNFLNG
jgi:hypothetical protein